MKKRIISLILVAAMALLVLASCGFNYSNETMSKYAEFNNAAFEAAVKALKIEDADFSQLDATKRENMVMDAIWAAIAAKADTDEKLVGKVDDPETEEDETEAAIGEHDLVYYSYYVTANIDGKDYMFFTGKMKDTTAKVQLGQLVFSDDNQLNKKIVDALAGFVFTEDSAYTYTSSGTITADQYVYVSYVRTHTETTAEGVETKVTETVADHRVQVGKGVDAEFTKLLEGKTIGTSEITGITEVTIDSVTYTYDDIYVKYAEKSGSSTSITVDHILYPTEDYEDGKTEDATWYEGSDSTKKKIDLAGETLTYHIFPSHYVKVSDYTVETIINDVFGADVTISNIAKIVLGDEYLALTNEDHATGDDHDHEAELETLYDKVMIKDKDGNEVDVNEFVKLLATAMSEYKTAKTEYDKAVDTYDSALKDFKNAYEAYYGDGKDNAGALKNYEDAKEAATAAAEALTKATATLGAVVDNNVSDEALNEALAFINADATNKADLEKKENAVKTAQDAVTAAEDKVAKATEDLANAEDADKEAYQTALDSANAELTAAKTALENAQKEVAATVIKTAETNAVDNKMAVLEAYKATAEAAKTAADKDAETKKTTSESKKTTLDTERKDYVAARKTLYGTYDSFMTELDDAEYATKLDAYKTALAAYEADKSDANKAAAYAAYQALIFNKETDNAYTDEAAALKATDGGKDKTYTEKLDARNLLVKNFTDKLAEKNIDFKFGYEYYVQYKTLEDAYNLEIKQAIAKEIYNTIFASSVTINETPKSEVDKVYEELIDNFQFFFYENYDLEKWLADGYTLSARDSALERYYDKYGASFERFLYEYAVEAAYGDSVENATEAKNAIRARAAAIVNERVVIYTVAEGLGVKFTDDSFKAYANEEKGIEDIFQYDDGVVEDYRLACQVEVILDKVIGITETLATEGVGTKGYKPNTISVNTKYFADGKLPIKEETNG